jgi:D-alanyl-lipoteichoic acid acyltransferase DltB (MBOAT superfamily)
MNVPSYEFLAFAALAALLINVWPNLRWRRLVWLVANVAFVLTFTRDPAQLAPFAGLLAFGFVAMRLAQSRKNGALFVAFIVAIVVAFCVLKRYTFVPAAFQLPYAYLTVGMSYVFFRILHLVIDAYQDALPDRVDLLSYANFTLNFTAFVAGPIQLYGDYRRAESATPPALDWPAAGAALERILVGFFKVSILSPLLGAFHQRLTALGAPAGVAQAALDGALLLAVYPVYLYFNFSGYTDFVIGVARFLRLVLPENFNQPFSALGFLDFWGRWHMSLANWVKTYVYSPLFIAMMRRFPSPRVEPLLGVIAYFVAFFVVGIWHGQTSMFVFLGVLLGLGVSMNKLFQIEMIRRLGRARYRALCAQPIYAAVSRGATFTYFAFCSLWFWSSWAQLGGFVTTFGAAGTALAFLLLWAAASVVLSLPAVVARLLAVAPEARAWLGSLYVRTAWYTVLAVLTISVTAVINAPAPHIVYRAF